MSANFVHRAICALFFLLLFRALGSAQIAVGDEDVSTHRLGSRELIHGTLRYGPVSQQITLRVIVNTSGYVDSAKAVNGPENSGRKRKRSRGAAASSPSRRTARRCRLHSMITSLLSRRRNWPRRECRSRRYRTGTPCASGFSEPGVMGLVQATRSNWGWRGGAV